MLFPFSQQFSHWEIKLIAEFFYYMICFPASCFPDFFLNGAQLCTVQIILSIKLTFCKINPDSVFIVSREFVTSERNELSALKQIDCIFEYICFLY